MNQLPIDEVLPRLRTELAARRRLVLQAPPGAGKTTRVPLALLGEPWLAGRTILMLEPRRLAARAAAAYMAELLGEPLGESVGYRVRFDSKGSARTRIQVGTDGILGRRLQQDPELTGVGLVIFDEFHERHLHSDLALALCLDSMEALRDDLALLVMLPCLTLVSDLMGILGGALFEVYQLDQTFRMFLTATRDSLVMRDITTGLIKSLVFGLIITMVGCYEGFSVKGGAEGVGKATTSSVVMSIFLIIFADVIFTAFFYYTT